MIDDLVKRLRDYDKCHDGDVDEAADEIERITARLAAAEALLREAVVACRREFLQTTGPNTEWYDTTRLMRDWYERAKGACGE